VHPGFHDALAYRVLVAKAGKMTDRIEIHARSRCKEAFRKCFKELQCLAV
jgi:hypothetical protein